MLGSFYFQSFVNVLSKPPNFMVRNFGCQRTPSFCIVLEYPQIQTSDPLLKHFFTNHVFRICLIVNTMIFGQKTSLGPDTVRHILYPERNFTIPCSIISPIVSTALTQPLFLNLWSPRFCFSTGVVPECGNDVRMVSATRSARIQYIITRIFGNRVTQSNNSVCN